MASDCMHLTGFDVRPYKSHRIDQYCSMMSHDNENVIVDKHVKDVLTNQGFTIEERPRSVYKVEKLYERMSYYTPGTNPGIKPGDDWSAGIALAYSCFARPEHEAPLHVLPFTARTVVEVTSKPSASAGLTNYGCSKAESYVRALERGVETLKNEKKPEPCLAGVRTGEEEKVHLIWMYPFSMTCIEGLVAYPLLEMFKGRSTPMAFAETTLDLGSSIRTAQYHNKYSCFLDMSKYDSTVSATAIHQAFNILRTWYDPSEIEPTSGKTVKQIFDLVETYFIHTPIVMPDHKLYLGKKHGVPSGSYFTQMIDSITNVMHLGTMSAHFNWNLDKREIKVLGDDLLFFTNTPLYLDRIAQFAESRLHINVHTDTKSSISKYSENVEFLGRIWENGLPNLSTQKILSKMVYPERFRKYSDDPEQREKEVRYLILSYVAVWMNAWGIAAAALGVWRDNDDCGDVALDREARAPVAASSSPVDFASGYQRYQALYVDEDGGSVCHTPSGLLYYL